jgi:hypothetical protein
MMSWVMRSPSSSQVSISPAMVTSSGRRLRSWWSSALIWRKFAAGGLEELEEVGVVGDEPDPGMGTRGPLAI